MTLDGQVAVITGAARGLGKAFSLALAEAGATIVAIDIGSLDDCVGSIVALGRKAVALNVDIADASCYLPQLEAVLREVGGADILINNAASTGRRSALPFEQIDEADWDQVMAVNLKAMWLGARAAVPSMRARGRGRIINMASGMAFTGQPALLHYISSKGGVIAFTRALARELAGTGITVNAVAPGYIQTEGASELASSVDSQIFEALMTASQIVKRLGQPDDLVGAMLYLASEQSAFMSGQLLNVDGGLVHY